MYTYNTRKQTIFNLFYSLRETLKYDCVCKKARFKESTICTGSPVIWLPFDTQPKEGNNTSESISYNLTVNLNWYKTKNRRGLLKSNNTIIVSWKRFFV